MLKIDVDKANTEQKTTEALRLLWEEDKNCGEISKLFKMSRQRVHQLIPGEGAKKSAFKKYQKEVQRQKRREEILARVETNKNKHGTEYTYKYYGCRCELCTAANTTAMAERRVKARATVDLKAPNIPHGVTNTYRYYGCRCKKCVEAHRISCKVYYLSKKTS